MRVAGLLGRGVGLTDDGGDTWTTHAVAEYAGSDTRAGRSNQLTLLHIHHGPVFMQACDELPRRVWEPLGGVIR
jgi:hypothetical protein